MMKPLKHPFLIMIFLYILSQLPFIFSHRYTYWDESVYLGIGKYIYSLGSSGLWEPIRPLGLPIILGPVWKLHIPYLLFSGAISLLFSLGVIALTYSLARTLFGKREAILAAAFLATSRAFFYYSHFILTEIPSVLFVLAAAYFFIKQRYYLAGIAASLAMIFKFTNALLIPAFGIALLAYYLSGNLSMRKLVSTSAKAGVSFVVITLPFLVFNAFFYKGFGNWFTAAVRPFTLASWHQANPAKVIPGMLNSYSFYLVQLFKQHFAFVLVAAAAFVFWKKKWYLNRGKTALASVMIIYLAYFSYIPNKDERFLLTFLPIVCIFVAAAFFEVFSRAWPGRSMPRQLAVVSVVVLLVVSFAAALYTDCNFYSWLAQPDPAVSQLYSSPSRLNITGPIMTSDPVFAAYNDNLFIPFYDTSQGIPTGLKPSWGMKAKSFEAVIYSPQAFYCPESDISCIVMRNSLQEQISSSYTLVFNGTYFDSQLDYFIYINESFTSSS